MGSQEFDYKTEIQCLHRFKAIETSYEGYTKSIYYYRQTVTTILVYYFVS